MLTFVNTGVVDRTVVLPNPANWNHEVYGVIKTDTEIGKIQIECHHGTNQGTLFVAQYQNVVVYFMSDGKTWTLAKIANAFLADGDYGDITVSASGGVWTIDPGAVSYGKIQDETAGTVLGRLVGIGPPQELSLADLFGGAVTVGALIGDDEINVSVSGRSAQINLTDLHKRFQALLFHYVSNGLGLPEGLERDFEDFVNNPSIRRS